MMNKPFAIATVTIVTAIAALGFIAQRQHQQQTAEVKLKPLVEEQLITPDPVAALSTPVLSAKELDCLAKNVYFESKNQSIAGQMAVALVTLNRAEDPRFPSTVCRVVSQSGLDGRNAGRSCQFSWYCNSKSNEPNRNTRAWEIAIEVAKDAHKMYLKGFDITNGATHFHATYVNPFWAKSLKKTARIDDHIFYRWDRRQNA